MTVSMHEAKTHFSRLVKKANEGEEIIVTNRGEPVARIEPLCPERQMRNPGRLEGKLGKFSWKGWKAMDAEIEEGFGMKPEKGRDVSKE